MNIIMRLKKYFETDVALMDDEEYHDLVDKLGTSAENQKKFINYVLQNKLKVEDEYKIFVILIETYGFETEDDYNIVYLNELYNWILKVMFKKEFYNYSMCYRFSDLLIKMSKNIKQVFQDIIENMNIYNPISIQIGMCSIYSHYDFFQYKDLSEFFLSKILMSIDNNEKNQGIIKDFNRFVKRVLENDDFKEYKMKFKPYIIDIKQ